MGKHNCNLNIHYSVPDTYWDKLEIIYKEMPFWDGYVDNTPTWYGTNGKMIDVSVEPSGLSFYAELPQDEWNEWIELFKKKASVVMGYEVGEPEDGFEFHFL